MTREYRFFLETAHLEGKRAGDKLVLEDTDLIHQIKRVLRLSAQSREKVIFLDGREGIQADCFLQGEESKKGKTIALEFLIEQFEKLDRESESSPQISIYLPLIKAARFEFALEKLTELGVDKIIPVTTKRTTPQSQQENKERRWPLIIKEAAEQSERILLPHLSPVQSIKEAVQSLMPNDQDTDKHIKGKDVLILRLAERSDAPNAVSLLYNLDFAKIHSLHIFMGPEGGLTDEEEASIDDLAKTGKDVKKISLGKTILRAETAAMVAAGLARLAAGSHIMSK